MPYSADSTAVNNSTTATSRAIPVALAKARFEGAPIF